MNPMIAKITGTPINEAGEDTLDNPEAGVPAPEAGAPEAGAPELENPPAPEAPEVEGEVPNPGAENPAGDLPVAGDIPGGAEGGAAGADPRIERYLEQVRQQFVKERVEGFTHPESGQYFPPADPAQVEQRWLKVEPRFRQALSEPGFLDQIGRGAGAAPEGQGAPPAGDFADAAPDDVGPADPAEDLGDNLPESKAARIAASKLND